VMLEPGRSGIVRAFRGLNVPDVEEGVAQRCVCQRGRRRRCRMLIGTAVRQRRECALNILMSSLFAAYVYLPDDMWALACERTQASPQMRIHHTMSNVQGRAPKTKA